jgi:hypothetical protein
MPHHEAKEDQQRSEDVLREPKREILLANGPHAELGGIESRKPPERRLLRKIDLRMSMLTIIYILNFVSSSLNSVDNIFSEIVKIDRSNVGAARLRGFEADLHLKG